MITYRALCRIFGGRLEEARVAGRSHGAGRLAGLQEWNSLFGFETHPRSGAPMVPLDERGLPVLPANRAHANEVSLRGLAESLMGHEFVEEYYHPSGGFDFRDLREAAIDPTAFQNINVFNLATAGLVNAEIMERFNQPEFFGRNLVTVKPTKMNGQKLIAVARMGSVSKAAKGRLPVEQHAEIGFSEAYQTTPETLEQALKCRVMHESVFYDLTGQVLDEAGEVGHELGYGQEKDIADMVLGVTNSYNRNGTAFNTYQTASPWINDISNPLVAPTFDWTSVDTARQLFIGMTDPESGKEIQVNGKDMLVMPGSELLARQQVFGTNVQLGTQAAGNFPAAWTMGGNPLNAAGTFTITSVGAIWYNRALAADGLNLSAVNAKKYWFIGDYAKAFWWMENWPMTPWMASADEYVMKDQGIVAAYGCNYRGVPYVREPRYTERNKN